MDRSWPLPNRVGFGDWMLTSFSPSSAEGDEKLFRHQALVRDFLQPGAPYRGILIYHALGSGKTCTAITVAEALRAAARPVVVMLPASLKQNFADEVAKCGDPSQPYAYVHYNGLTRGSIPRGSDLAGKTVIVDEAHNFCATATKDDTLISSLYEALMSAADVRIILLSGTPIINSPFELSRMMNLLRGPTTVYKVQVDDAARALAALRDHPDVDGAWLDAGSGGSAIMVTLAPPGFSRDSAWTVRHDGHAPSIERVVAEVRGKARAMPKRELCLPSDPGAFMDRFIDWQAGVMKEPGLFMRRIQGLVSHFAEYDASIYPSVSDTKLVKLPMTEPQFNVYRKARDYEIKLERLAKDRKKDPFSGGDDGGTGVYKAFSRAACNYAFPPDVRRPSPKNAREEGAGADAARYDAELVRAMDKLDLSLEAVAKQAPKFVAIRQAAMAAPGPVLVYSDFRTVEGVGLFARFLGANGWSELRLAHDAASGTWGVSHHGGATEPRFVQLDTSESKEHNALLLKIFNNKWDDLPPEVLKALAPLGGNLRGEAAKMLLVTKSGAEGITLSNVRQVHIMEPYWNMVRVQQIIGRAVRAHSHASLPPKERHVDVFMYQMELTEEQRQDAQLKAFDLGQSTDETVYAVAQRKRAIIEQFLDCLKRAAVDCTIHGSTPDCLTYPAQLPPHARADDDVGDEQFARRAKLASAASATQALRLGPERFKHRGRELALMVEPKDVLVDARAFAKLGRLVPVGLLRRDPKTKAPAGVLADERAAADALFGPAAS